MSTPAVVKITNNSGPAVVRILPPGAGVALSDSIPQPLGTAAAGTATTASRSDHRHAMPTAAGVGADAVGTAAAAVAAAAGSYATAAQGALAASAVQPAALSSYLTSATAATTYQPLTANLTALGANNAAYYLARANHTGTQAASTITGLATVATTGAYADLSGRPTAFDPASPGAIGGTTAAAGSFTALSASTSLLLPNSTGTAAGHTYRSGDTIRYRDSGNVERLLLNSADNLANLGNTATARSNLGAATLGAIGSSGLTMNTSRILGRSTAAVGAPEEFALLGLAFNSSNLATLADVVIPLSDETSALTASSSVAKVTIPYWPRATVLIDLPIWAVATAPTGAALQFDIQVGGSSIFLPASGGTYPTIAASSTNSTASAGAFTTAFAAAPSIAVGSSVTFFVRQIGSTVAGAGLKVVLPTRRAG